VASVNQKPEKVDITMDFLYSLDNSHHTEFKAKIVNDIQKGILTQPEDLNKIYIMASCSIVVPSAKDTAGGATFAMVESTNKRKPETKQKVKYPIWQE
jgi:hypothetical protein